MAKATVEKGDLVASTDNKAVIDSVYKDCLTVTYDAPKPKKKLFTVDDLVIADKFSFGSAIGSITNKGTNGYALLPLLEAKYGKESEQAKLVHSRLKQCCVAQSREIDKAKIGRKLNGIPKVWVRRQRILDTDTEEEKKQKELMNQCLLDTPPYFFIYRYNKVKKEWQKYQKQKDTACKIVFGMSVDELLAQKRKTSEQSRWIEDYYCYAPVTISDSAMNLVCRYIESVNFKSLERLKSKTDFDWSVYVFPNMQAPNEQEIIECYKRHLRDVHATYADGNGKEERLRQNAVLREKMSFVCSNPLMVSNALVKYLYGENPKSNKDILWDAYGKQLMRAVEENCVDEPVLIPARVDGAEGVGEYLGMMYEVHEAR